MNQNLYLYFSGTGNTRYVLNKFASLYEDQTYDFHSIEDQNVNFSQLIQQANIIIIGYPIHESMMPFIMQDFLDEHINDFKDKRIIVIVTQMLFSGDGALLAYRRLKKANVTLLHSIHINMPNNLTDISFFKPKDLEHSKNKIKKADKKIHQIITKIKHGHTIKMGRRFYSWFLGFFTQRLYGYYFYKKLRHQVKIHHDQCILCQKCIDVCPTDNLLMKNDLVIAHNQCTVCYRCVNLCPKKAISIMSKRPPKVQYLLEKYHESSS